MHNDDVEGFLEELDTRLNAYRSARIAFIKLSQRPDGDPRPTITTWQRALDKITATQNAVLELVRAQPQQYDGPPAVALHDHVDPATGERLKS
jgi:hypothetical protein